MLGHNQVFVNLRRLKSYQASFPATMVRNYKSVTKNQNQWDAAKTVLKEKFIAINAYIKK